MKTNTLSLLMAFVCGLAVGSVATAYTLKKQARQTHMDAQHTEQTQAMQQTQTMLDETTRQAEREAANRQYAARHIDELLQTQLIGYQSTELSGISNVRLEIRNTSAYLIERCTVELPYYLKSGALWKTNQLVVTNLLPNSSKELRGPDSPRGMRVGEPFILGIQSEVLGL
jgi:type II secretory pathway component PulJ